MQRSKTLELLEKGTLIMVHQSIAPTGLFVFLPPVTDLESQLRAQLYGGKNQTPQMVVAAALAMSNAVQIKRSFSTESGVAAGCTDNVPMLSGWPFCGTRQWRSGTQPVQGWYRYICISTLKCVESCSFDGPKVRTH